MGEAALAGGTLIVCQASENGMTGREFQVSVSGGTPLAVQGGRCSGALAVPAGSLTVQQLPSDSTVTSITTVASRVDRSVSPNPELSARRIRVLVPDGTTFYSATRVTFTNEGGAAAAPPPPADPPPGGADEPPPTSGLGLLEICKFMAPGEPAFDGRPFAFRIDRNRYVTVRAGRCSLPLQVSAGDHVITELLDRSFELVAVETLPAGRVVSRDLPGASATVRVPAGADETTVLFTNRVARGQVKLCKEITPGSADALAGKEFVLGAAYSKLVLGVWVDLWQVSASLRPGECSLPSEPAPVMLGSGEPVIFQVFEQEGPGYVVDRVHVQGAAGPFVWNCGRPGALGCFPIGRGTNVVHVTNRATSNGVPE